MFQHIATNHSEEDIKCTDWKAALWSVTESIRTLRCSICPQQNKNLQRLISMCFNHSPQSLNLHYLDTIDCLCTLQRGGVRTQPPGVPELLCSLTCVSTNMAMSMNISCSSLMLDSSFMMSLCRDSISFRACLVIWESEMIWGGWGHTGTPLSANTPQRAGAAGQRRHNWPRNTYIRGENGRIATL